MARWTGFSHLLSVPEARCSPMHRQLPTPKFIAVTPATDKVTLIESYERPICEHELIDIRDRMALVAPALRVPVFELVTSCVKLGKDSPSRITRHLFVAIHARERR